MHEHLAEPQEEDVGEGECDADTDVPADSSSSFAGRKRNSHYSEDESRERQGKARVFLNQGELDIRVTLHPLYGNQVVELLVGQRLHGIFSQVEILDGKGQSRVNLLPATDLVRKVLVIVPDKVFLESPFAGGRVINRRFSGNLGNELIVFNPFQGEAVGSLVPGTE